MMISIQEQMVGRATSAHSSQDEEVTPLNFNGAWDDFGSVIVRPARIEKFEGTQSPAAAHVSTQRLFVYDLVAWNNDVSWMSGHRHHRSALH